MHIYLVGTPAVCAAQGGGWGVGVHPMHPPGSVPEVKLYLWLYLPDDDILKLISEKCSVDVPVDKLIF